MKKKVGLITIHSAHNYGAILQAYALQRKIFNFGYDCELIDYATAVDLNNKKLFRFSISLRAILNNLRVITHLASRKQRYKLFEDFINGNMILTKKYDSVQKLNNEKLNFDIFVTGSDQTFNLQLSGEPSLRYPFYLSFVKDKPKIAYAASFGEKISEFTKEDIVFIKSALSEYSYLGVRELSGVDFIKHTLDREAKLVLDPTLLLDKNEWDGVATDRIFVKGDYILFYSVLSDGWAVRQVNELSRHTGLPVVAVHLKNRYELGSDFIRAVVAGPAEFIGLIKNAKIICTTSFHATVFSIIFNKPFYSLKYGAGARIGSLLNSLELTDRLVDYNTNISVENIYNINYERCNTLLMEHRADSQKFLMFALKS